MTLAEIDAETEVGAVREVSADFAAQLSLKLENGHEYALAGEF